MTALSKRIGFIGAGNMGEAFVGAILKSDIVKADGIFVSDVNSEKLNMLKETYGIETIHNNAMLFHKADIVILAVKPQHIIEVLSEISGQPDYRILSRKLVISIVAGTPLNKIEHLLYYGLDDNDKKNMPIVRVMPNTPALVLSGMSGMSPNRNCTKEDTDITRTILAAIGKVAVFKEEYLDAVTAMSGSGPAYVFYFIEAMIEAGLALKLNPQAAAELTLETIKGAVKLLEAGDDTPEILRHKVTSPGGTTEAALNVFEENKLKKIIIEGIKAAADRSEELSGL